MNYDEWSEGYFSRAPYVHGYNRLINPQMLRMICVFAGVEYPSGKGANYLELGFGQGLSINIHASANEGSYWGVDFNAIHASGAKRMAAASEANIHIFNESFRDFSARSDLPEFDFIVLHGVWSWISDENRAFIVDIINRRLRVGGIVYVSYNCFPGWAPIIPVRELMTLYMRKSGRASESDAVVSDAISFAREVLKSQSTYLAGNPVAAHHLDTLGDDYKYIAHEYLNSEWEITTLERVANQLAGAQLNFVASTRMLENIDAFCVDEAGKRLLDEIRDPVTRVSVMDYMMNARFRCDVFAKGALPVFPAEHRENWKGMRFTLVVPKGEIPSKIKVPRGEVDFFDSPLSAVSEALFGDEYAPKTIDEILDFEKVRSFSFDEIVDALIVMMDSGYVSPAKISSNIVIDKCKKFNRYALRRASFSTEIDHLASPVTGGGVMIPHIYQLFLGALVEGKFEIYDLVGSVQDAMSNVQGGFILGENNYNSSGRDDFSWVHDFADDFLKNKLPLFKALLII
ncbi:class I SAM-dependent methyltransferase [Burkholderia cenocepacia]|uniref:class I SAM-dependent methyltransferase n=1 Tax=Burkholderia cenocepacia TaxID=95486 RepID=UPI002AB64910|nr:class I SAM-dependent methyltransferase [Burkholderia cenocepacia]